ncbi:hypothetical protein BDR06DRAFT_646462 [Suillus hirtellus]|nr:hypothetical protein BDR06DRAFT_646462 [Suillus hirtellus]
MQQKEQPPSRTWASSSMWPWHLHTLEHDGRAEAMTRTKQRLRMMIVPTLEVLHSKFTHFYTPRS